MKKHPSISHIPQSLIVLLCTLLALLSVPTITAAAFFVENGISYDLNSDGVVDNSDIELIKDALISNNSDYCMCDVVRATRISTADVNYSTEHKVTKVSDLKPSDENNMFFINTFMNDFQMVIHEDEEKVYLELLENGVIYYTTEWEKDYNVVYNLDIENDHIVQTEYNGLIYKAFIDGSQYKLDVVDPNYQKPISMFTDIPNEKEPQIGTALAATFFRNDYPVSIEDVELVSNLFSDQYEFDSVRSVDNYVEFYFTHCDGMAEYIIRVPYCDDITDSSFYDEKDINVLGCVYYGGKNYVVFSEKIDDLYIVQVSAD